MAPDVELSSKCKSIVSSARTPAFGPGFSCGVQSCKAS